MPLKIIRDDITHIAIAAIENRMQISFFDVSFSDRQPFDLEVETDRIHYSIQATNAWEAFIHAH